MRTVGRLKGLQAWITDTLCSGRELKAPAPNMNIGEIVRQEPRCYIAWAPARMDTSGKLREDPISVCPGIIIMPNQSFAKYSEEKRHDRINNIMRPELLRRHLSVSILFCVYEPGIRLPGFIDSVGEKGQGLDMSLIKEGTEEGLCTLLDWMDDGIEALLGARTIPGTDLYLEDDSVTYALYTDQNYVVDRRPVYYGFINATFGCYSTERVNETINELLL